MNWNKLSGRRVAALLSVAVLMVSLMSCSKNLTTNTDSLYVPTAADVTSSATLPDLQAGRSVFINSCGRCHNLYSPDNFSVANWRAIVPNMASRAGLSSTETTQVTKYVTRGK